MKNNVLKINSGGNYIQLNGINTRNTTGTQTITYTGVSIPRYIKLVTNYGDTSKSAQSVGIYDVVSNTYSTTYIENDSLSSTSGTTSLYVSYIDKPGTSDGMRATITNITSTSFDLVWTVPVNPVLVSFMYEIIF